MIKVLHNPPKQVLLPESTVTVSSAALRRGADIIADDYYRPAHLRSVDRLAWGGLHLTILEDSGFGLAAVIRGSDDVADWWGNLRIPIPGQGSVGDSGRRYGAGLMTDARRAYDFLKGRPVDIVLGHSRGAALAAIIGWSLGRQTIAFACPRYVVWEGCARGDTRLTVADTQIVFVNRSDDRVARMPPAWTGLRRVGVEVTLNPPQRHPGEDHRIYHYVQLLGLRDVTLLADFGMF